MNAKEKKRDWIPAICIYFIFAAIVGVASIFLIKSKGLEYENTGFLPTYIFPVISFVCLIGLWLRKKWGRLITIIYCLLISANYIYYLVQSFPLGPGTTGALPIIIPLFILKYLITEKEKFS